jgi:hypothetical protein
MVYVRVMHGDNARNRAMLRTIFTDDKLRTAMRESSEARDIAGAIPVIYSGMKINPESPTAECVRRRWFRQFRRTRGMRNRWTDMRGNSILASARNRDPRSSFASNFHH